MKKQYKPIDADFLGEMFNPEFAKDLERILEKDVIRKIKMIPKNIDLLVKKGMIKESERGIFNNKKYAEILSIIVAKINGEFQDDKIIFASNNDFLLKNKYLFERFTFLKILSPKETREFAEKEKKKMTDYIG